MESTVPSRHALPSLHLIQSRWPAHSRDLSNHDLTGQVYQTQKYPFARGGYSDVYKGKYKNGCEDGRDVRAYFSRPLISADASILMSIGSSEST